jgi:hypothetical protein
MTDYASVKLEDIFLSESNASMLNNNVCRLYENQEGKPADYHLFLPITKKYMDQFAVRESIHRFVAVNNIEITEKYDWLEVLRCINNRFLKFVQRALRPNALLPSRATVEVGDGENRHRKKFSELLAHDIPTIDVWAVQEVQQYNQHFRYNNTIPVWQRSMAKRHYDRSNEGLAETEESSSRETIQRGFDMSEIQ